jgi:hypothetical protein
MLTSVGKAEPVVPRCRWEIKAVEEEPGFNWLK